MRAEKRIVNAKKELVKLKEVAARLHGQHDKLTKESIEATIPDVNVNECPMQIDQTPDGSLPAGPNGKRSVMRINNQWMNQRKIKAIKSKIKRHTKKKQRRSSSAGLSSRRAKKGLKR